MEYVRVSDVVDELSVARRDDNREEWLRYLILSKSVLRDLKVTYIPDFKRVYLPIDAATMTVRVPLDYQRFRTISVIQKCYDKFGRQTEKVLPLTYNPYINITPVPVKLEGACDVCGCVAEHPVCVELASYTTLCEEIIVDPNSDPITTGTKQTVLKTCPNGDIIKEVTQPTLKFIKRPLQCDYTIIMEVMRETVCDYTLVIDTVSVVAPTLNVRLIKNGYNIDSGSFTGWASLNAFFTGLGWTTDSNGHYHLNDSTDVWDTTVIVTDFSEVDHIYTMTRHCKEDNVLVFPYTILSYNKNGIEYSDSPPTIITSQAEQDSFFDLLGFAKVNDTTYTIDDSPDTYFSMEVELGDGSPPPSPPETAVIYFTQSECHNPIIVDGVENVVTTDVLCNVEIKDCGCIVESKSCIDTIVSCCSPYLNCCQEGELNNWSGWNYVPSCCPTNTPQPYNMKGTYNFDETNLIIYLDSVSADKVLLAYDTDGSCQNDYAFPIFMTEAFKAGIAWRHAQYNEMEFSDSRRRELKRNFEAELTAMDKKWIDPIYLADLIGTLKTPHTPY